MVLLLEIIKGAAYCDRCEEWFDNVVMLNTGSECIALCSDCKVNVIDELKNN